MVVAVRGGAPPPPLFLDQTEAQRAAKSFLETSPAPLSKGLDDRPTPSPPNLKVWIRHFMVLFDFKIFGYFVKFWSKGHCWER